MKSDGYLKTCMVILIKNTDVIEASLHLLLFIQIQNPYVCINT